MTDQKTRIGIITYHRVINYGAILQTYALQSAINIIGVESVIIDYRNKRLEKLHRLRLAKECRNISDLIKYLLIYRHSNRKHNEFRNFAGKNLKITDPISDIEELEKITANFDIFITGSDQVWNYKINEKDPVYFLGFVKDRMKKHSYAASFGLSEIPSELREFYTGKLIDFQTILVREKQGQIIIMDLLSKKVQSVLDPTLLISKEHWSDMIKTEPLDLIYKYILVYAFGGSRNIYKLASSISHKTGLKIIVISSYHKPSFSISYKSPGPLGFLKLIQNAEYIITNSFHGAAFSINFNKEFFVEMLPNETGVNSRLEDILDLFDLRDRIITGSDYKIIENKINYYSVNKILDTERQRSLSLLKEVVLSNNTK